MSARRLRLDKLMGTKRIAVDGTKDLDLVNSIHSPAIGLRKHSFPSDLRSGQCGVLDRATRRGGAEGCLGYLREGKKQRWMRDMHKVE